MPRVLSNLYEHHQEIFEITGLFLLLQVIVLHFGATTENPQCSILVLAFKENLDVRFMNFLFLFFFG